MRHLLLLPGQSFGQHGFAHIAQPCAPEPLRFAAGGQIGGVDSIFLLAIDIFL
jgi:hypothetical protein